MSKHFALIGVLVFSMLILPFAGLRQVDVQGQRRGPPPPKTWIVKVELHADLKETYTSSHDYRDVGKENAELTMTEDYTGLRQMTPYIDGSASFDEIPKSPGLMSGSFHYSGQDDSSTKGPDRIWSAHKMDVAGSLDPVGEVDLLKWSGKNLVVRVSAHSGEKLASCESKGSSEPDPRRCWLLSIPKVTLHDHGDCNGTCGQYQLWYELHPSTDRPTGPPDANMDYINNEWYGATTSGIGTSGYIIELAGKKSTETNRTGDDPSYKDSHEKNLHVSIRISPPGLRSSTLQGPDRLFWLSDAHLFGDWLAATTRRYDGLTPCLD